MLVMPLVGTLTFSILRFRFWTFAYSLMSFVGWYLSKGTFHVGSSDWDFCTLCWTCHLSERWVRNAYVNLNVRIVFRFVWSWFMRLILPRPNQGPIYASISYRSPIDLVLRILMSFVPTRKLRFGECNFWFGECNFRFAFFFSPLIGGLLWLLLLIVIVIG